MMGAPFFVSATPMTCTRYHSLIVEEKRCLQNSKLRRALRERDGQS